MNVSAGPAEALEAPPFLSVRSVSKSYGGAHALRGVSLSVFSGQVHGLVGANGAGKSTLIRILAGLTQPDGGDILIEGKPVAPDSPHVANKLGMSFIHQELAFVPGMTVLENIMLGMPKKTRLGVVDWRAIAKDVAPVAARVGVRAPLDANAKGLPTAENWLINIARALVLKARLIVMDEPTAALSAAEAERLFGIIHDLRRSGVAVLYVSHRLDEVLELCRRVTVFRDGRSVAELAGADLTRQAIVEAIVGGAVESPVVRTNAGSSSEPALSVRDLARAPKVKGVSFDLRKGEVLGLGGLVGAGRTELARLLFGVDRAEEGSMTLEGKPYAPRGPRDAVKAGVGFVPEERRVEGLILSKSLAFNLKFSPICGRSSSIPLCPSSAAAAGKRSPSAPFATLPSRRPTPRRRSGGSAAAINRRSSSPDGWRRDRKCSFWTSQPAASMSARGRKFTVWSETLRRRAWRCLSYPPSRRSCRTCATGRLSWPKAGSSASWPARR